ncbi:BRO-N domain-containing protein [Melghirimyces algeriensis]|uniref:Prophage antirepressor n=1 Tax=Melghirimyces algeriensis TaxID=910412 RepID=A0A521C4I7_9BACL|nr:BRO family protein [Melghirimyces algeriensis]SMO54324.1 Prophage antirepressor [Melghirimyces algeriensis]
MDIKIEKWNDHEIRFIWHNGEWWAVAKDVAKALDYKHAPHMARMLNPEEKDVRNVDTLGGAQKMTIISETGIYEAIFNSRKKEAKEFKTWVKQILKELRQQAGLEGFQVFRMLDKEHQQKAMGVIKETLGVQADKKHFIKANTVANKAVSSKHGYPKMVPKPEMTPEMLKDRQPILEEAAQLTAVKEAYGLDFSVSKAIYKKHCK